MGARGLARGLGHQFAEEVRILGLDEPLDFDQFGIVAAFAANMARAMPS